MKRTLKDLLAKATPLRSGDVLAGVAAATEEERVRAQMALAEVPLIRFSGGVRHLPRRNSWPGLGLPASWTGPGGFGPSKKATACWDCRAQSGRTHDRPDQGARDA